MNKALEIRGLVPKLRFPEFRKKDQPWLRCELRDVTAAIAAGLSTDQQAERTQFPVTRIETISDGTIDMKRVGFVRQFVGIEAFRLDVGDILLSNINSTEHIGKSVRFESNTPLYHGMNLLRIRPNPGEMLSDFLCFQLSTKQVRSDLRARSNKAVNQASINQTALGNTNLLKPTLAEQRKIAECFQSLDELIAAETEKLNSMKRHKKALLQQLFPVEGETTPRLRFPQFRNAGDWAASALGQVCETSSGGTPLRSQKDYWNGDIPWITTSLINGNRIVQAEEFITELAVSETLAKLFPTETIVIAMYGQGKTRGKVAVLGIPATTNQACAAILPKEGVSSQFLFFQLFNGYERLRSLSNSGGQDNLSQTLISQFEVALPPDKEEQLTIASVLNNAAVISSHQEIVVARLRTHKNALMQQLFPSIDEVDL